MQQTENLNLNLIEGSDPVDWEVLNENMEKLDEETADIRTNLTGGLAAVTANLGTVGKNARIAWGTYTGNGKYGSENPNTLTFDFNPVWMCIASDNAGQLGNSRYVWPMSYAVSQNGALQHVTWTTHGVSWYCSDTTNGQLNQNNTGGYTYHYVVIGYDD